MSGINYLTTIALFTAFSVPLLGEAVLPPTSTEGVISLIYDSASKKKKEKPKNDPTCFAGDFKCNKQVFSIFGEWIYFKAIEDSLKYAQKTPQNPTLTPISSSVEQKFDYTSGVRVGLEYRLPKNSWEIGANWMWYETHNDRINDSSDSFGILAVLALPVYGISQNSQVNGVKGNWSLKINSVDLDFKMPLHISKKFILTPLGGIKAGFVSQTIKVDYSDFLILQPLANTPQTIEGRNTMWGVGPMIGMEANFLFTKLFSIFFKGNVAGLCGQFNLKTTYSDFLGVPAEAKLTVRDTNYRISLVEQIQAGLEKKWQFGKRDRKYLEIDLSVGWEVQVWTKQMRLNLFDTFVEPSNGSDLTLYGPFVKGEFRF